MTLFAFYPRLVTLSNVSVRKCHKAAPAPAPDLVADLARKMPILASINAKNRPKSPFSIGVLFSIISEFTVHVLYCTFGNCNLVFFRTRVDRYGGALVVLGMSENPGKPSFRSPNGLLAPFLA